MSNLKLFNCSDNEKRTMGIIRANPNNFTTIVFKVIKLLKTQYGDIEKISFTFTEVEGISNALLCYKCDYEIQRIGGGKVIDHFLLEETYFI